MREFVGGFTAVALSMAVWATWVTAPAVAQDVTFLDVFGSSVEIRGDREIEQTLIVAGKTMLSHERVDIDRIDRFADTNYLLGSTGPGGNFCDPAPFIVSFPTDGPPKLFGPLETCRPVSSKHEADRIVFTEGGVSGETVKSWTWIPGKSLSQSDYVVPFVAGMGWSSLWDRTADHPADLLGSEEIAGDLRRLTGDKWGAYRDLLAGVGSAEFLGDFLIGTSCLPHQCGITGQLTALDLQARKAYAAIKEDGRDIVVFPAVGEWPDTARRQLAKWAKPWVRGKK